MLQPRITGTEMEYPVMVQSHPDAQAVTLENVATSDYVSKYLPKGIEQINGYASNGSRIYFDVGRQLEYATPEDTSFVGTLANEIAGEQIIHAILDAARCNGRFSDFSLNKRVVDHTGTTWGYHESYSVDAQSIDIDPIGLALLGMHLATRNIFVGAGAITKVNRKQPPRFVIGQKSVDLWQDYDTGTLNASKPVVNLRQEPLANRERWRRIHITSGDANMSPWATIMKLGTTSLVLRLMEHGINMPSLRVPSDRLALQRLALLTGTDISLARTVQLKNGQQKTPLQIQTALCQAAIVFSEKHDLPTEEQTVLGMWDTACKQMAEEPKQLLDRVEWMYRREALDKYAAQHGRSTYKTKELQEQDYCKKDRQWDSLRSQGIGAFIRTKAWKSFMPEPDFITERITMPPDTRAKVRGAFVSAYHTSKRRSLQCTWAQVGVGNSEGQISLPDPFESKNHKVQRLIDLSPGTRSS